MVDLLMPHHSSGLKIGMLAPVLAKSSPHPLLSSPTHGPEPNQNAQSCKIDATLTLVFR